MALSFLGSALILRDGILEFRKLGDSIEVRGLDERTVKSDQATWQIRYVVSAEDMKQLFSISSQMNDNIISFLVARGFSKSEIQKTPLSVSDRTADNYANNSRAPRFSGRGSILVSTANVDLVTTASEATDTLLSQGVILEGSEVAYYFTGLNSIKPEMLKAASQSATAAAESLAKDTGVSLGKVKQVSQGLFSISSPFSEAEYTATSSVMKKVRVVTKASYAIE